jgi:H+/Cl- antiporter ClcA
MRPAVAPRAFVARLIVGAVWTVFGLFGLYGAIELARDAPHVAYPCFAVLGVVFGAVAVWDVRLRMRSRESQRVLASLPCPSCRGVFGSLAAHDAFHPPRLPRGLIIDDDFGYATVKCPHCGEESMFHRTGRELVHLRPPSDP